MPAAVPAAISIGAVILAGSTDLLLAKLAIMAAGAALSSAISRAQAESDNNSLSALQGIKANGRSSSEYLKVLYGQTLLGGNDVYMGVAGADNKDLWIVQTLGEGPCDGIAQVDGVDQVFLNGKLPSEFGGNVSYWFHAGEADQAVDANLAAALPEWTDPLPYTCYIVWKLTYNQEYFSSLPTRTVLLKGRLLYDFRTGTTAWSENHALALYDYMTNARYGMGMAAAKFDTAVSWPAAANYYDAKGWKLHLALAGAQAGGDVIDTNMAHCRSHLNWRSGLYCLGYEDLNYETPVMTLTDEHIARDDQGRAIISIGQPGRFKKPDGIRVTFVDPDKDYATDSFTVGEDDGVINELQLSGCDDRQAAGAQGIYELERSRLDRTVSMTGRDDLVCLEPYDPVVLTSTALRLSAQPMRVVTSDVRPADGLVDLVLQYDCLALYDDEYNLVPDDVYTCNLPDPNAEPAGVANVTLTEETYQYRLRSFTRLKVAFDKPAADPWFDHAEVWVSYDNLAWEHLFNCAANFEIDPVQEGTTYYLRLKAVSIWGRKGTDDNDYRVTYTVGGCNARPSSVSALQAVVNSNTINLYAQKVTDADVELYEFRLGTSWAGAIFLAAHRSPNLSLYGVKPGAHTFLANTLSNNGQYGATPRSATVSLIDPPDGWAVQNTQTCDYSAGSFTNTEQATYNSESHLKCSHTSGVLTGTYLSPVYDLGASARYMVYCQADLVVTGAGTTWASVIPSGTTWSAINIATRRWSEIFELAAGPAISIKLNYGDTSALGSTVERQEILSAIVTGRYFQVSITITDPSAAVNALVEHFTLKFCQ